jgi:hypothetical protein
MDVNKLLANNVLAIQQSHTDGTVDQEFETDHLDWVAAPSRQPNLGQFTCPTHVTPRNVLNQETTPRN